MQRFLCILAALLGAVLIAAVSSYAQFAYPIGAKPPPSGGGPWVLKCATYGHGIGSGSPATSGPADCTGANLIVVLWTFGALPSSLTVSDSTGMNTYSNAVVSTACCGGNYSAISYVVTTHVSSTMSFTITGTGNIYTSF